MPFPIEDKLVIAIASSALFDLSESDLIYRQKGEEEYRKFQRENESVVLAPGVAFPFIKRLLSVNRDHIDEPVEVILLSRNDADTGLRVFNSIEHYGLPITRAGFLQGQSPWRYIKPFNASLFLSANEQDVKEAIMANMPAGRVLDSTINDDPKDTELRVAFDFDGVLADDASEQVFQEKGLEEFQKSERSHAKEALSAGPMKELLAKIAALQKRELQKKQEDPSYEPKIKTAIITSRNAPAHARLVHTLRQWGIAVDATFMLGGMDKARILAEFRPHIFFDDQLGHLKSGVVPCVHVPFGIANVAPTA